MLLGDGLTGKQYYCSVEPEKINGMLSKSLLYIASIITLFSNWITLFKFMQFINM